MTVEWDRIAGVFEQVTALPPDERAHFLDDQCGDDVELRREVESLLEHDTVDYLTPPHLPVGGFDVGLREGASIGGFRLVRRIGSGGMGAVYEAEQLQPHRRVALKVLPPMEQDPGVLRRFAQEAELLARMNHPAIAQIFATGVDGTTPWFAMELVEGALPITEYARRNALSAEQCVDLFRQVCAAVAHGHAKGVIHRDIKPGNLLVDAHGVPKVIDFGIARALDAAEGEAARMTRTGDLVGTLQYMSPEQAEGRVAEVDAQSDVHALGLVLYEMLTGRRAYAIEAKPLTQSLRVISEDRIASARSIRADLPPEIEWILGKALEKERTRRYASVLELDADLQRFLVHQPVLAGPPSRLYEARKFVRRHRVGVAALVAVFLALSIGIVISLRERARAEDARDQLAARAKELEIETARKDRVLAFQRRLLTAASPDANGYDVRVVDLLDLTRGDLESNAEEPAVAFELHESLGAAYGTLGRQQDALMQFRAASDAANSAQGISADRLAQIEREIASTRARIGTEIGVGDDMRALLEKNRARFGPSGHETLLVGIELAAYLRATASLDEAKQVALDTLAAADGSTTPDIVDQARSELATVLYLRGQYDQAEPILRTIVASGGDGSAGETSRIQSARHELSQCLQLRGKAVEAEQIAAQTVEVDKRRFGPAHPTTLLAETAHAQNLLDLGRRDECVREIQDVDTSSKPLSSMDSLNVLDAREQLAYLFDQCGDSAHAVAIYRGVFAERSARHLEGSAGMIQCATLLSQCLTNLGEDAEAEAMAREAVAMSASEPPESRVAFAARHRLGLVLVKTGRAQEALPMLTENVELQRRLRGPTHDDTLRSLRALGRALSGAGRSVEAEQVMREELTARVEHFGPLNPSTLSAHRGLSTVLEALHRPAEAEAEYCEYVAGLIASSTPPAQLAPECIQLGSMRADLHRGLDALDALIDGYKASRALSSDAPQRLDVTLQLAEQWLRNGMFEPVAPLLEPIQEAFLSAGGAAGGRVKACRSMLLKAYDELGRKGAADALRARMAGESKGS